MIKMLKCTIVELNSRPLYLQSDALPVELSMPLTFLFITLKIVAISKCLSDIRVNSKAINAKNRYFNC